MHFSVWQQWGVALVSTFGVFGFAGASAAAEKQQSAAPQTAPATGGIGPLVPCL